MRFVAILFFCLCKLMASGQSSNTANILSLKEYQQRILQDNDTLYVVNFWATWCGPCVKEIPYFKAADKELKDKPIKFILMSLDAQNNLDQVNNFLLKKGIQIETHILAAGDPNVWINQLEPSWEGSIPATFLYQKGQKISFKESYFSNKKELVSFINNRR